MIYITLLLFAALIYLRRRAYKKIWGRIEQFGDSLHDAAKQAESSVKKWEDITRKLKSIKRD